MGGGGGGVDRGIFGLCLHARNIQLLAETGAFRRQICHLLSQIISRIGSKK